MVELAAITAALINVAHQFSRLTAVWGVLKKKGGTDKEACLMFLLLDLLLVSLKAQLSDL